MSVLSGSYSTAMSTKERHSRIKNILTEIRREKPLGKCPLFKMSLTFRSFVWSPSIDSIYSFSTEQKLRKPEKPLQKQGSVLVSKKPLLRSHSFTSLKSTTENFKIPSIDCVDKSSIIIPVKTERKDKIRLNVLSNVANTAIKIKSQIRASQQGDLATQRSHKLGVVPKYLTSRKAQWAQMEEEKLKNLPDPDCPIGHVMMPESERIETLNRLQQSQIDLNEEFNCLPLSKDSLKIRQRKEDIEKQLTKVEEGIRVLSKPKVFVRIDI
ncbi:enkurin domain-containing protein 1-like [Daphnia pulicaria]|uniref:enkurin domain-containing protein 1-like n=1 Tax=Daphnia pulicaria TaxID=35523 RepID=UPI001EEBDEB2|nr:enkurin domain-containing protein 1-like [Daphnia pulicaria]